VKASTAMLMANTTRDSGMTTKWKAEERCTGTSRMKNFTRVCGPTTRELETVLNVGTLAKFKSLSKQLDGTGSKSNLMMLSKPVQILTRRLKRKKLGFSSISKMITNSIPTSTTMEKNSKTITWLATGRTIRSMVAAR
jgi:hypothetical protein